MRPAGSPETNTLWPANPQQAEEFYKSLHRELTKSSAQLSQFWPTPENLKKLFSPYVLKIPKTVLHQAQEVIHELWCLSRDPDYQGFVLQRSPEIAHHSTSASGVLMAYDFHLNEKSELRLIEVNTNASGFLFADPLYKVLGRPAPSEIAHKDPIESLLQSFAQDYSLFYGRSDFLNSRMAIVDENLFEQKMLPEFYLYQNFFENQGIQCTLVDLKDLSKTQRGGADFQFIYNRHTDFYLADKKSEALRKAYLEDLSCLSPHPRVYALLADKGRMIDWQRPQKDFPSLPFSVTEKLLSTQLLKEPHGASDPEVIWQQRKNLFFKPKRSHGGKQVYRGASLSRKMFEKLTQETEILVQEFFPPGPPPFDGPLQPENKKSWKYDLRFYAYEDHLQLAVGRLYQGQVTNFHTDFGGFTALTFY